MSQMRSYSKPGINVEFAPIEHKIAKNSNVLRESDLNPELKSILDQIREDYQTYMIEKRMDKTTQKRHNLIVGALIFFALTSLIMVLQFKGLLNIGSLVEIYKL